MRRAAKRDENEDDIVTALRNAGCDVIRLNEIDLVVGLAGYNYLFEVKRTATSKLTPFQRRMREFWGGQYDVVTTPEEALRIMGLWV